MWVAYQAAMSVALLVAGPVLLLRRGRHYLASLPVRLGLRLPEAAPGALWIHAVSVGEVGVAATLARALDAKERLLVTTITPSGQERARAQLAAHGAVTYLPFDLAPPIGRFLRRFAPRALVLVEGDYWPLLLRAVRRRGLPVYVVNGRVSDRTFPRLWRLRRLLGPLFSPVTAFGVQTDVDRERLLALGVAPERVVTTGNLKYETAPPPLRPDLAALVARLAAGRPVLVAGSTMPGEEEQVLEAFDELGGGERALLVLAPRHPERWDEVAGLLGRRGIALARRSAEGVDADAGAGTATGDGPAVLLLDSLGELAALYGMADACFVGGTLSPTGGHNPLEPARFARPLAVGPSMQNFRAIADDFDRLGAWRRVRDAGELAAAWREWLDDPIAAAAVGERARSLLEANRGALERTLALLAPVLATAADATASGGGSLPAAPAVGGEG